MKRLSEETLNDIWKASFFVGKHMVEEIRALREVEKAARVCAKEDAHEQEYEALDAALAKLPEVEPQ